MQKLKLLVVDDEPGIRSGIIRILKNYTVDFPFIEDEFSYEIIEAATGEEALDLINKSQLDIILLDNKLPGIEGVEVLEYINKIKYDALVMMITSYASLELAVKSTKNGAYNFVPKPFTPTELKSAIENITKHLVLKRMTQKMHTDEKQIKYQFLSMLSHELKSPINAVEGYLRILSEKQVGEKVDDYMEMIDRSLIRLKGMRHLIGDLLDLTKIESGEKSREIKNTDIIEIARYARDTMEALAATKHVKIFLDAPDTLYLEVDRQEIEIIFNNLLSNAIKYNKESGSVNFTIKENSSNVQIIVEDTGVGMSKEDRAKLFQEFVRLQNVNTRGTTGTGLGLSIVKKIVEMNYGTIEVSSIPNEGSTFTILLPGKAVKNS